MSRKRVRWLVALLLILGIALVLFWWFYLRPPFGITQRSFAKIQVGMSLEEVEAIIGRPPSRVDEYPGPTRGTTVSLLHWFGSETTIKVILDETGVVLTKECDGEESNGFLSRLLQMLGL